MTINKYTYSSFQMHMSTEVKLKVKPQHLKNSTKKAENIHFSCKNKDPLLDHIIFYSIK